MKVALVYDRVNKFGGAERVLMALHEIWPEAPLFTSVYNCSTAPWARDFKIITSFLQKLPLAKSKHELFPLLMPVVFESFDFTDYDVIISVTSEAAKGIITIPGQLHLCYCLTPTRYLWSGYDNYFTNSVQRIAFSVIVEKLRKWDLIASQRPDKYIAISETVQARIKKYYGQESKVIYPPVDTNKFEIRSTKSETNSKFKILNSKFYLVVSRLVKYKKVDLAIEAFTKLGWNLKIAGTGREMENLKSMAGRNIELLGQLTDEELISYYQNCEAVIFPTEEDFGIVPLEAMACGKPVVAFNGGGAVETIVEGITGEFFYPQTAEALREKILRYKDTKILSEDCRNQAEKFSKEKFKKEFKKEVEKKWQKHIKNIFTR